MSPEKQICCIEEDSRLYGNVLRCWESGLNSFFGYDLDKVIKYGYRMHISGRFSYPSF